MKSNWKKVKLSDICDVRDGTHDSPKRTAEGRFLITSKHIKGGKIDLSSAYKISLKDFDMVNQRSKVDQWDILLSMIGTIGEVCIVKEEPDFAIKNVGLIKTNDEILSLYLYYYLKTPTAQSDILARLKGTTQQYLSLGEIRSFPISIPQDDRVMRKITKILSSIDDKIELNNKINRNLEAQAQAIFKSWFIDFEPFKNGKFIDSELGRIPEGWKVKELGKVSKNIREKVVSRTNIPVLSAVKEGRLILSEEYFSKQVYSKSLSKYILVKENDYAYNPARVNIGSLGRNTICSLGCVSPVYIVFEIDSNYLAFFDLYFKMKSFKNEVKLRASGSVRQTLSYDDFSLIKVIYPPKSVSSKFNKLSAVLSEKIIRNKKESRSLAQLRDTILPKLMSGEIDISNIAV